MTKRDSDTGFRRRHEPGVALRMSLEARRISSQHRQLDAIYGLVVDAVNRRLREAARSAFNRFQDAIEAHFSLEEEFYFPALHGMRSDLTADLDHLVGEHGVLREAIAGCEQCLGHAEFPHCMDLLDQLATSLADHEDREEQVLARIRQVPER